MKKNLLILFAFFLNVLSSDATTYTVTTNSDAGVGSLRQAIINANANTGTDTIIFNTSLSGGTVTLASVLTITDNVFINGLGAGNPTISGNSVTEIFHITNIATIQNLALTKGLVDATSNGGGILMDNYTVLTLTNCSVTSCTAGNGGAIYSNYGTSLTITTCTISSNICTYSASTAYAGGIYNYGNLTISNSTFSSNSGTASNTNYGGAIFNESNLTMNNCTITSGGANYGGGICNFSSATLNNCTISSNGSSGGNGGGVYNSSSLSMSNCTISGNTARYGGGMCNNGIATLTNCTISGNSVGCFACGSDGGGIYTQGSTSTTLMNCTVANNSAGAGYGIYLDYYYNSYYGYTYYPSFYTTNSIYYNPSGTNIAGSLNYATSYGYNISSDATMTFLTATGDKPSTNPLLNALAANGGFTQTASLQSTSPAINNGTASSAPVKDQRGYCRSGVTDIGACEYNGGMPPTITAQYVATPQSGCPSFLAAPLTVTVSGTGLTYQWYSNNNSLNYGGTAISTATLATYTPATTTSGTLWYYCIVSNGSCYSTTNVSGAINVYYIPSIYSQPSVSSQSGCINFPATALSVGASGQGITYQWYSNTSNANTGGTAISGGTSSVYTPLTSTVGTLYYYCIVSGTCSPAITSNVSGAITVTPHNLPTSSFTSIDATCIECNNGSAAVTPSGGATPYTYSWAPSTGITGANASSVSGLSAGNYTVTITDANACVVTPTVNIAQPSFIISTIAGNGPASYNGDGIAATSAYLNLNSPNGIAVDVSGNVYIADPNNQRVRKVNTAGVISTIAGNGGAGYNGDGIAATAANLYYPVGVAVDVSGNIYISDYTNRIRKVNTSGIISTVAGNGGGGYNGDGILATTANLNQPNGIAVDIVGNIYISDIYNGRIRKVNTAGVISTIAGSGFNAGYNGDGIAATTANLYYPNGVAVDVTGNVYISDQNNERIRKVNTAGIISTIAGNGNGGYNGDGVIATSANLFNPTGVGVDASGNVYISDLGNQRIRTVNAISGIISTIAGTGGYGFYGDGMVATVAGLAYPSGIGLDASGNIYISDQQNQRIRKLTPCGITISAQPSATVQSVCVGSSAATLSITATSPCGGLTYQWYSNTTNTASGGSIISGATSYTYTPVTSSVGTLYYYCKLNGTDATVVTSNVSGAITVNPLPTITINSGTICNGQSFTLTPSGANTYTFSAGATVSPTTTTSYSVTGTSATGCVSASAAVATVTVNSVPTISVTSGAICKGQSFTLTPSGANTYTYSSGSSVVSPTTTASYSITGTSAAGCVSASAAVATITVNSVPTISVTSGVICNGQSFTLTPSGANTYTYSSGTSIVSPTTTASYSITGTSSQGCISSNTVVATVTVNSVPTISVTSGAICNGQSFTLTPSGANTYTYSSGTSIVSPTTTTSYSVAGTSTQGCVGSNTAVATVTVNSVPTISVTSGAICKGQSFTLTPSGANTYTYSSGISIVSPTATASYSVTGTSAQGCVGSNTVVSTITVNTVPTISVTSGAICKGQSFTMTPSGANTYTYSSGTSIVSPTATTSYSVTGTSAAGCIGSNTAIATVTVNSVPTISVTSGAICNGQSFTLTPSGANTYTYSSGSPVVTPTTTASYSVTGTSAQGCIGFNTAVATITVNSVPTISVTSGAICNGQIFTLTPSGANTYTYSSGSSVVSPTATASYSITGTSSQGCISSNTVVATVTVKNPTTATISPIGCNSITVNATTYTTSGTYTQHLTNAMGCDSALIINATINLPTASTVALVGCNNVTVNATTYTTSGTYTQHLTNAAGCDSAVTINATINLSTTSTLNVYGCSSVVVNATTYTASGTYTQHLTNAVGCDSALIINATINLPTTSTVNVTGCSSVNVNATTYTASGTYTQYLTNAVGCDSALIINATINLPTTSTVNINGCSSVNINATTYTTSGTYTQHLTNAVGCDSALIINATINLPTTSTVNVTGCSSVNVNATTYTASGTYTQHLTSAAGCDSAITINAIVKNAATYTQSPVLCNGQTITVGINTYTTSGTYTDILTAANGCDSIINTNLTVRNAISTNQSFTICTGQNVTVGASTYTTQGTFTNTLTAATGCDSVVTTQLIVNPLPIISVTSATVCAGQTTTLTATGANTYTWSTMQNGANISVTPSTTATYTVTGLDINNCSNTAIADVDVNCTMGVNQIMNSNEIIIYPNPTTEYFYLGTNTLFENTVIEVYDIHGRKIVTEPLKEYINRINLAYVANGVYQIRVISNNVIIYQGKIVRTE